jgi:multiple sugar transport system substrate-binding protein
VPTLREIEQFRWDVVSLPVIDQAATVLHSDAFCVAANTGNVDDVWTFVEFAGGEQGQLLMAETGRTVPSMISVSESPVFLEGIPAGAQGAAGASPTTAAPLPPANSQVYLSNIQIMHRLPSISTWVEVEDAFDAEFDRSLYIENFDVTTAAAAAIANSRDAFDRSAG